MSKSCVTSLRNKRVRGLTSWYGNRAENSELSISNDDDESALDIFTDDSAEDESYCPAKKKTQTIEWNKFVHGLK